MNLLYRIGKAISLGVLGFTVVGVAPLKAQGQSTTAPVVKILPGKRVSPARNTLERRTNPAAKPLSGPEKVRLLQSTMKSINGQKTLHPSLDLKLLSINRWPINFNLSSSTFTLSAEQPWIKDVGYLVFSNPSLIGGYPNKPYNAGWNGGQANQGAYLGVILLNVSAGKDYVLDFTLDQIDPTQLMEITIDPSGGATVLMQMSVTQGHLLVPVVAGNAGMYSIFLSCNSAWAFSSVVVNQL